jgi:hypothetical protein
MSNSRHGGKTAGFLLSGLTLCAWTNAVIADSSGNPCREITGRNVFALKPPNPVKPEEKVNKPPPLRITLTGIVTLGHKRALIKASGFVKPSQPAAEQFYLMAEGQREGDLEVIEINEKAGAVKVNNAGTIVTLSFAEEGVIREM